MSNYLKKNKSTENLIDEYMANITSNCEKNMTIFKKFSIFIKKPIYIQGGPNGLRLFQFFA